MNDAEKKRLLSKGHPNVELLVHGWCFADGSACAQKISMWTVDDFQCWWWRSKRKKFELDLLKSMQCAIAQDLKSIFVCKEKECQ